MQSPGPHAAPCQLELRKTPCETARISSSRNRSSTGKPPGCSKCRTHWRRGSSLGLETARSSERQQCGQCGYTADNQAPSAHQHLLEMVIHVGRHYRACSSTQQMEQPRAVRTRCSQLVEGGFDHPQAPVTVLHRIAIYVASVLQGLQHTAVQHTEVQHTEVQHTEVQHKAVHQKSVQQTEVQQT